MVRYENECVSCRDIGMSCMGDTCPNRRVAHFYCDKCHEEDGELYYFGDEELCIDCLLKNFEMVTADE